VIAAPEAGECEQIITPMGTLLPESVDTGAVDGVGWASLPASGGTVL
jgi:hypothetical protein